VVDDCDDADDGVVMKLIFNELVIVIGTINKTTFEESLIGMFYFDVVALRCLHYTAMRLIYAASNRILSGYSITPHSLISRSENNL
jgi:hypothetical protein